MKIKDISFDGTSNITKNKSKEAACENINEFEKSVMQCIYEGKDVFRQVMEEHINNNEGYKARLFLVILFDNTEDVISIDCYSYCPEPDFNQIVYQYSYQHDFIGIRWIVPSQIRCMTILDDHFLITDGEQKIFNYIHRFLDGSLRMVMMSCNGFDPYKVSLEEIISKRKCR